ncbi:MAG: glycosyltransferase, partial [Acidobacteriota bacterium]
GRPAILVPLASATHDHQTFNARKLVQVGAAVMIEEKDLHGAALAEMVEGLLGDPGRLARMSEASRQLARPDAATRVAELCIALMEGARAA